MPNEELNESVLNTIKSIKDEDIINYLHIPVDIYLQEAENLVQWCQADREKLVAAGLDWGIVNQVLVRSAILRKAESDWITQRFTKQEAGKLWKEKSIEAFQLRNSLLHTFRYAYRKNTYILGRINSIADSQSAAAIIQDINDLSVLGKNNFDELKAINFDPAVLDQAASIAAEVAGILAASTAEGDHSMAKKFRDKAFTYLKQAVDEVCECGQFVFWKDDARKRGYSSSYLRRTRRRREKTNTSQIEEKTGTVAGIN